MTLLDLLNLAHIQTIMSDKLVRIRVKDDGYLISNYQEGMDPEEYMATEDLYLPRHFEYFDLCVITREEHEQHLAEFERIMADKPIEE